ncbi:uncharacterized protein [Dermacentor andersoni]|uniref:uncharacterized protein n=1 Tax=Dermacentor andersoni TaxID=34620 RepID=UPI0021553E02|nr:uncharacterized protein LOC126533826 [Dermacentor andersoni]
MGCVHAMSYIQVPVPPLTRAFYAAVAVIAFRRPTTMKGTLLAYSFLLLGLLISTPSGASECSTECPSGQQFSCFSFQGTCSCTCLENSNPCEYLRGNTCPEGYFRRCVSDSQGCTCRCDL